MHEQRLIKFLTFKIRAHSKKCRCEYFHKKTTSLLSYNQQINKFTPTLKYLYLSFLDFPEWIQIKKMKNKNIEKNSYIRVGTTYYKKVNKPLFFYIVGGCYKVNARYIFVIQNLRFIIQKSLLRNKFAEKKLSFFEKENLTKFTKNYK